jgi:hypothetical protein
LALGFLLGCGAPPLVNAQRSAEGVASAVLDALARRDRAQLETLALNEAEFRDHVWADLPAARPERNLPLSYVWGDLHQKSTASLTQTLDTHGGRRYELLGVDFEDRTDYGAYRVHRTATLRVRDASGQAQMIRVCGSMIERDGAWKVFSYLVDD